MLGFGQILNVVTPSIVVVDQPGAELEVFNTNAGDDEGTDVALTVIDFELEVCPGALSVRVTVYVPEGNVTGNGVNLLSFDMGVFPYSAVPVPENCQLTVADGLFSIPLPVETKENKTVEPAQIFNVLEVC